MILSIFSLKAKQFSWDKIYVTCILGLDFKFETNHLVRIFTNVNLLKNHDIHHKYFDSFDWERSKWSEKLLLHWNTCVIFDFQWFQLWILYCSNVTLHHIFVRSNISIHKECSLIWSLWRVDHRILWIFVITMVFRL